MGAPAAAAVSGAAAGEVWLSFTWLFDSIRLLFAAEICVEALARHEGRACVILQVWCDHGEVKEEMFDGLFHRGEDSTVHFSDHGKLHGTASSFLVMRHTAEILHCKQVVLWHGGTYWTSDSVTHCMAKPARDDAQCFAFETDLSYGSGVL